MTTMRQVEEDNQQEDVMTKLSMNVPAETNDMAEGSPDAYEISEPENSLNEVGAPHGRQDKPLAAAETGLMPVVELRAEGKDDGEAQDAPRTSEEVSHESRPEATADASEDKKAPLVMIVEDTMELAEVIQATLERMSMTTYHESHGNKALERLRQIDPDVVLLDIHLPDMTGWKILDAIKEKYGDALKSPVVIVITAYGDPANRLVGKLQGVHSYLIKPFTSDEIEKVVTQALNSPAQ